MPRAAVLGSPVAHSLSPVLHRAAYDALGLRGWRYDAVECDEAGLPAFLDGLDEQWVGLSLTMPLKRAVIGLLDEVSELSRRVEAVNTVVLEAGGHRRGENTDVYGAVAALREAGCPPLDERDDVVVLGGGATAGSVLLALAGLGARTVTVHVRDVARAQQSTHVAQRIGVDVRRRPWPRGDALAPVLAAGGVVVSTVPAGAADALAAELAGAATGGPGLLLDVVYAPWPTPLARAWGQRGGRVAGGLDMLVHQAAEQVALFTGMPAPVEVMRAAGRQALAGADPS